MIRFLQGDNREVLKTLSDESVHMVATSPPFFGLRDYGTAQWEGGEAECDHKGPPVRTQAGFNARYFGKDFDGDKQGDEREPMGQICSKCGARRIDSQIGLEPTIEEHIEALVQVFREVRRVLRKDGVMFVEYGDMYAGSWGAQGRDNGKDEGISAAQIAAHPQRKSHTGSIPKGSDLKPKDLVGAPWQLAFALRADGWYLRDCIIWHKPNPMPESVRDRCTKAHSYVFLFAKSPRYFYDATAIAEEGAGGRVSFYGHGVKGADASRCDGDRRDESIAITRNKRSVWTIATQPFKEAHFATWPTALVEPMIKAGCPVGGTVLDCFAGSGTTGLVADRLGRNAVLIDLNGEYVAMAKNRLTEDAPLFVQVAE